MLEKRVEALREGIESQMAIEVAVENDISASEKILILIAKQPDITISRLVEHLMISRRSIERHVKALQENHQIERVGATKKGFWRIL